MIDPKSILEAIENLPPMQETGERNYLGASEIGHPCQRYLWLKFHKYVEKESFSSRMLRLFYRGQREEGFFEMYLRETGFEIIENCFSQKRFSKGFFSGAGDGIVEKDGFRFACEYKTHSAKSFASLEVGDLKKSFPKHFDQCQINARMFNCVGTIYLAVNKDNDELFCDVILMDEKECDRIEAKAQYITQSDKPPERIAKKVTDFACKFCHAKNVCWGMDVPRVNCRNCTSATKHYEHGVFTCEDSKKLDDRGFCENHSFNPYAINGILGWEPIEFFHTEKAVKYKKHDGTEIINGSEPFGIPSNEIKI